MPSSRRRDLPSIRRARGTASRLSIGQRAKANEAVLSQFLQSDRVTVLLPDEQTTHVYADVFAQLRRAGTPIPTNDLWIAALVIQHDLVLFSRDKHFDVLPQIARI